MQTVLLPGSATPTSRIGLGCGRLAGGTAFRTSAAVVEAALAAGIRHFDVAPSYGLGLAEDLLGRTIGAHSETTVTTKAGIAAPKGGHALSLIRQMARPLVAHLPGVKARLAAAASAAGGAVHGRFAPEDVRASFEASLRALRRDRVDVFLLHEPPAETPAGIGPLLEELRTGGQIGAYGAGTGGGADRLPSLGKVAQHAWTPGQIPDGRMPILHGLLRHWLPRLRSILPTGAPDRRTASDDLGFDLDDPDTPPALLLTLVLSAEPGAMVLVSSNSPGRVTRIVGGVDWAAVRGERPNFVHARDRLIAQLAGEAVDV